MPTQSQFSCSSEQNDQSPIDGNSVGAAVGGVGAGVVGAGVGSNVGAVDVGERVGKCVWPGRSGGLGHRLCGYDACERDVSHVGKWYVGSSDAALLAAPELS